jgi:hypothetical protein
MPYIDPEEIERIKRIDLLSYLERFEPDELVRLGTNSYCTKEHDSLKISNGCWQWWSQGIGGKSALDFLIKVRGMAFLDAVKYLGAKEVETAIPTSPRTRQGQQSQPKAAFVLPRRAPTNEVAIEYLTRRGISPTIISHCIEAGLVYAAKNNSHINVAFVGYDGAGHARYAAIRATVGTFKQEAPDSDKRFSFRLGPACAESLHVFEGAIDVLSYATLAVERGAAWRNLGLLSLGGIQPPKTTGDQTELPLALAQYLEESPTTTRVFLHLDNDKPGRAAARAIASALGQRGVSASISLPPVGRDVNEYLMLTHSLAFDARAVPAHESCPQPMKGTGPKQGVSRKESPYRAEKREGRGRVAAQERSR